MITTDEGLAITIEQLGRMARVLELTCKEELPRNRQMFELMADGPLGQIQRLLDEINDYMRTNVDGVDAAGTHAA
jgi:hypothetical protein